MVWWEGKTWCWSVSRRVNKAFGLVRRKDDFEKRVFRPQKRLYRRHWFLWSPPWWVKGLYEEEKMSMIYSIIQLSFYMLLIFLMMRVHFIFPRVSVQFFRKRISDGCRMKKVLLCYSTLIKCVTSSCWLILCGSSAFALSLSPSRLLVGWEGKEDFFFF